MSLSLSGRVSADVVRNWRLSLSHILSRYDARPLRDTASWGLYDSPCFTRSFPAGKEGNHYRPPTRSFHAGKEGHHNDFSSWMRYSATLTRSRNNSRPVVIPTHSHMFTLTLAFTHPLQIGLPRCWSTPRQQLLDLTSRSLVWLLLSAPLATAVRARMTIDSLALSRCAAVRALPQVPRDTWHIYGPYPHILRELTRQLHTIHSCDSLLTHIFPRTTIRTHIHLRDAFRASHIFYFYDSRSITFYVSIR